MRVRSLDLAGNVSAVASRTYRYVPPVVHPSVVAASVERASGREFHFIFPVIPGSNYVLQTSTDLLHWSNLSTNRATAPRLYLTNDMEAETPQRFFKLQPAPQP